MDFYVLHCLDLVLYACVIVVFTAFALSRTLLVTSCYVDKEDGDGLAPFVYKSVLRDGEALSFTKFISVFFYSSQTY